MPALTHMRGLALPLRLSISGCDQPEQVIALQRLINR